MLRFIRTWRKASWECNFYFYLFILETRHPISDSKVMHTKIFASSPNYQTELRFKIASTILNSHYAD